MGNHYIRTVSRILIEVFGEYGAVYRIGGDEFCVVSGEMSEDLFRQLSEQIEKHMQKASERYLERRMSVACGYAAFDAMADQNLRDVISWAEQAMYRNQQHMKKVGSM